MPLHKIFGVAYLGAAAVARSFPSSVTSVVPGTGVLRAAGGIAEYEGDKIGERALQGKREKGRRGLIVGGPCPPTRIARPPRRPRGRGPGGAHGVPRAC